MYAVQGQEIVTLILEKPCNDHLLRTTNSTSVHEWSTLNTSLEQILKLQAKHSKTREIDAPPHPRIPKPLESFEHSNQYSTWDWLGLPQGWEVPLGECVFPYAVAVCNLNLIII